MRTLTNDPATLADGVFKLEEKKGLLSRLLSRKPDDDMPEMNPASAAPRAKERTEEERRRIAETKALVEEALQDS